MYIISDFESILILEEYLSGEIQTWYNAWECFQVNFMKRVSEKGIQIVTWYCHLHSFNRNSNLHNYNRNSDLRNVCEKYRLSNCNRGFRLHNYYENCHPRFFCRNSHLDNCNRKIHQHNCNWKYHLSSYILKTKQEYNDWTGEL